MNRLFQHHTGQVSPLLGRKLKNLKLLSDAKSKDVILMWIETDTSWLRIFIDGSYCGIDEYNSDQSREDLEERDILKEHQHWVNGTTITHADVKSDVLPAIRLTIALSNETSLVFNCNEHEFCSVDRKLPSKLGNSSLIYSKLKIEIWPGQLNIVDIELNDRQLLVVKSALPFAKDHGEAFHSNLSNKDAINEFGDQIQEIIQAPTEKKVFVISDGMEIKLELIGDTETLNYTLNSIQPDSKEMRFVEDLFTFTSVQINNEGLTHYLDNLKRNYLI